MRLIRFCFFMVTCLYSHLYAQGDLGIIVGISNYQGDIPSYSTENGFSALVGPVLGIHTGYQFNTKFQLRGDILYTRLSGDDRLGDKEETRARNFDFFSPVFQLAGGMDWNIFGFDYKAGNDFTPYLTGGVSLFYMNPKTIYLDQKVALHPLGTEGQYLPSYPEQKPYSLIQPSLQFGGGIKFLTGSKIIVALEAVLSYTFTDYIDDVSTIYISYPELFEEAGPLAAALGNRQGEYLGIEPVILPTGSQRGNPDANDYFGVITLRVGVPVDTDSGQFKVRSGKSKTIRCPKF